MDTRKIKILQANNVYRQALLARESFAVKMKFGLFVRLAKSMLPLFKVFYSFPEPQPCDVLFLFSSDSLISRTAPLRNALQQKGLSVAYEKIVPRMSGMRALLAKRMLSQPSEKVPIDMAFDAALACYLVKKFQPKVVCSFTGLASSFLRDEVHRSTGGKTVFLSHGIHPPKQYITNFDFDYFFVFGKSGLEYVRSNPIRIGATKVVLTGSPFIAPNFHLSPNREKKNLLFFSTKKTWITSKRAPHPREQVLLDNTKITIEWAKAHPEFQLFIKLHPSKDPPEYMQNLVQGIPNITVLDPTTSMVEALRNVSLVINTWSNASIEAALLRRPSVIVNVCELKNIEPSLENYLAFDEFFLPRATNAEELHRNIVYTLEHYDDFLKKAHDFAKFHLEHTIGSFEYTVRSLESIAQGKEEFSAVQIQEQLSGLKEYL